MADQGQPCVVGLTGGLASGKSTIAKILADRGVPVFDADAAVHELYRAGGEGAAAVADLFGEDILDATGRVDREALAARVLDDGQARRRLEAAIHPLVRHLITEWLKSVDTEPVAVVEAALLVETGSYRDYDVLVVAWCLPSQQLERAVARGLPAERARDLINAQLPLDEKKRAADVVVDNRGAPNDLDQEVDRAWTQLLKLCADRIAYTEGSGRA